MDVQHTFSLALIHMSLSEVCSANPLKFSSTGGGANPLIAFDSFPPMPPQLCEAFVRGVCMAERTFAAMDTVFP
ncbi:hypothetical protein VZT92_005152 [Zoarces viviparus]|uniref:Secreted protein n=1 Tax=Zoarces viviparus TaxID=48416 RepID=A0AAW1FRP4_ZOAVI